MVAGVVLLVLLLCCIILILLCCVCCTKQNNFEDNKKENKVKNTEVEMTNNDKSTGIDKNNNWTDDSSKLTRNHDNRLFAYSLEKL